MLVVLTLALTGLLAAGPLAPSAMGKTKPKPDLIVPKVVKLASGDAYAFQGKDATLKFRFVTKNEKKKGHDAAAGPSRTGLYLVPLYSGDPSPARLKLGSRPVPALARGESHSGAASEVVSTTILPLGAYKVIVCADLQRRIKERDEGNNCSKDYVKTHFYVIKESWSGSVNGVGNVGTAAKAEKWKTSGASLDFVHYLGGGIFEYNFNGVVEWTDQGTTTGGCTVHGYGGRGFVERPTIVLDYLLGNYGGNVHIDRFYTITFTPQENSTYCNGSTAPGPWTADILSIPETTDLFFEQNQLTGQFSTGTAEGATWNWDFR